MLWMCGIKFNSIYIGINYDHYEFDGNRAIYPGYDPIDNYFKTNLKGTDCQWTWNSCSKSCLWKTFWCC